MATGDQIKALLQSHAEGDDDRFYSVALQMAAHAARNGHSKLADDLRTLVDKSKGRLPAKIRDVTPNNMLQPRSELQNLLFVSYPKTQLSDVILPDRVRERLARILKEQRHRSKLADHSLEPRNKVLLVGPPGTGKTLTALALAGEMHLPMFTILFDGLITKYMGETAAKLRLIFDSISRTRGVYFFDEFDAIGSRRSMPNEVGEIRRVLNSFLQFLEQSKSESLIVAATNHPEFLDAALFRRFDDVVEYKYPTPKLSLELFMSRLSSMETKSVSWGKVQTASKGMSFADITRVCADSIKTAILDDKIELTTQDLLNSIADQVPVSK